MRWRWASRPRPRSACSSVLTRTYPSAVRIAKSSLWWSGGYAGVPKVQGKAGREGTLASAGTSRFTSIARQGDARVRGRLLLAALWGYGSFTRAAKKRSGYIKMEVTAQLPVSPQRLRAACSGSSLNGRAACSAAKGPSRRWWGFGWLGVYFHQRQQTARLLRPVPFVDGPVQSIQPAQEPCYEASHHSSARQA
jgi:hypothetical protein